MESQCDYSMYFPAVPFGPRELLSAEPGRYRSLPRRNHLFLGETVRFLLVLRCRPGPAPPPWPQVVSSLAALASVSPGPGERGAEGGEDGDGDEGAPSGREDPAAFRECRVPVEEPFVCSDEVIFPLTIALDRLPPGTSKAKVVVTVWRRDTEPPELQEGSGYLRLLQSHPAQVFRQEQAAFKAQVSTLLTVLPPLVRCRQLTVSGKYLTLLKVLNGSSPEPLSLRSVRVLPNLNAGYLPVLPDGSVLLVDDVCHHSAEVPVGSWPVAGAGGAPCALRALEEQNFLFQLQAPERGGAANGEGLEVPLVAIIQWSTPKLPFTTSISTHYRLPSIRLERPRFVLMATCESPVVAQRRFVVTYSLVNELQDFLSVRLVWSPETAAAGPRGGGDERGALEAVVCHSPHTNVGFSRKGSASTVSVAFVALRAGLFELSQHMKLKLQFTASAVPAPAPAPAPLPAAVPVPGGRSRAPAPAPAPVPGDGAARRSSPSGPALRELLGRTQFGLGRSRSFSHQPPPRGHLMRSGSVMERRAITPPVGSPVGRPLALPPERAVLALDKIAKRECKVLVVPPVQ
ncbi:LOW QUALITY PROTEIN: trafficking protein particle complex subunit 14-like [Amazona ochrocephala]